MPNSFHGLSDSDFKLLFEAAPDIYLILDARLRIVAVNKAQSQATMTRKEDVLGRHIFDVFPENPQDPNGGMANLRTSLEKVLKTKTADRMAVYRYDIPIQGSPSQGFTGRYWSPISVPVLDAEGEIKFILHRAEDVTESVELQKQNARQKTELHDIEEALTERQALIQELKKSEERLRIITDRLPAFVSYMDADHRYKFVNRAYSEWFGCPAHEIEGKTRAELVADPSVYNLMKPYEDSAFAGQTNAFELTLTKTNGEFINLDTEYIPVTDPLSGKVRGIIGVGQDVTARKQALQDSETAKRRYQSLSDSLPNMMWTADAEGSVNYANGRCLDYTGMGSQEKFGQGWVASIHPEDLPRVGPAWNDSIQNQTPFKTEYRIRRHDGEYRWFLGQAIPIQNTQGKVDYWIGTATDIHDEKSIAEELIAAKNAAENANRTKTAFLANMSHEIRTPLGAILGFSELLKSPALDSEERDQFVDTIIRNGKSLTRIIDDILDLAKVEAGHLETEEIEFSPRDLLGEVMTLFTDQAKQKNILLDLFFAADIPERIWSDPTRLRQILINVIGNALKFTDQGRIDIRTTMMAQDQGRQKFSITVTDTGRGIPPAQAERLFQPFTQADNSTTRRYGGTGLGLVLSRRLAEALGGTVSLTSSAPDEGSTFQIDFLVGKFHSQKQKTMGNPPLRPASLTDTPLKNLLILLVDDSEDNQQLVKHMLNRWGAEVDLAHNGREAVDKSREKKYDLVLMDIQMPEMDGYQALEILKRGNYLTPVIALTAHALMEERLRTKAAGFAAHLTKPIDRSELLTTVHDLVLIKTGLLI